MAETDEEWEPARLIPITGIRGAEEQETRATSALLAVIGAVAEFGEGFTHQFGAPKGRVTTFAEPRFDLPDGNVCRPDGLIRVRGRGRQWTALVEVKTGRNQLQSAQVETYLDLAREQGFDCVITISNQIMRRAGEHPCRVDARKTRKVGLHHISWSKVLTQAIMVKVHKGVRDEDQAWILGELIRYLQHRNAGAADFEDMGEHWVKVREAAIAGTLREGDREATEVANRWQELLSFLVIRLGRDLGVDVQEVLKRKELETPDLRTTTLVRRMAERAELDGCIRIPNTVGDIRVIVDVRAQQVRCSVSVKAPTDKRATTRVKWLVRQLKDAPPTTRVDCWGLRARSSTSELLQVLRERPEAILPPDGREITSFDVTAYGPMGIKRGSGRNSFVASVIDAVDVFYRDVVQHLKAWTPPAPRLATPTASPERPDGADASSVTVPLVVTAAPIFPRSPEPDGDHPPAIETVGQVVGEPATERSPSGSDVVGDHVCGLGAQPPRTSF